MSKELSIFFGGGDAFADSQRVAKALTASTLVPKEYQGNISNALVALDMAQRMDMNPLMVMQNLHIIHGRPAWSSKAMIAMFNQSGRFSSISYKFTGDKGTDDYGCFATAKDLQTGEIVEGPLVTMGIAKAEGWLGKNGSKWKTMPDLMLRYRAGSWLVNTVAPDISFGLNTVEEVNDIRGFDGARDVTPVTAQNKPQSLLDALDGNATDTFEQDLPDADDIFGQPAND
jgi:hypothetical protein